MDQPSTPQHGTVAAQTRPITLAERYFAAVDRMDLQATLACFTAATWGSRSHRSRRCRETGPTRVAFTP